MASAQVQAFVKFFSEKSHADQFVRGDLYMRKLRYFQRLEKAEADDGRPDANEGVVSWHQPGRVELTIEIPGFNSITIGKNDLAGPVSISRDFYSEMHLFCITALSIPDPAQLEGDHAEIEARLREAFQIDRRCLGFGPFAVVVGADKFMSKLKCALAELDHWYKADLVQYYNEKTFHGDFEIEEVPFRKQNKFSYQNEYRICLQTHTEGDQPIVFEIGDLSNIAIQTKSDDLNDALKVTLRRPPG